MPPPTSRLADRCAAWTGWLWVGVIGLMAWGWFPPLPFRLHAHMQWSDVVFALAVVPWLVTKPWSRVPMRVLAPLASWLVLGTITALTRGGLTKLAGSLMLAALMLMTADVARDERWRLRAARATAVTIVLLAALGLVAAVLFYLDVRTPMLTYHGDLQAGHYPRIRSATFLPNMLGSYAIFACAAGFALRGRWRAAAVAASFVGAALSLSRGLLGLPVVLAWMSGHRRLRWAAFGATGLLLLTLSAFDLRLDPTRPWEATLETGGGTRRHTALTALATAADNPLLGCGLDCIPGRFNNHAWDAHNTPLQIAATRGVLALGVFAWLLWRSRPADAGSWTSAVMVAILLDGMAQDVEDFRHLWVTLGLALSTHAVDGEADLRAP